MAQLKVVLRTADQTRKAEVSLDPNFTGADVIQASVDNWNLPTDTDYSIVSTNNGKILSPNMSLQASGIKDGDILEVQPVLVAG